METFEHIFEHIRTADEALRDAALTIYGGGQAHDRAGAHFNVHAWNAAATANDIEKALATEVAAGELAHAMLRRRIRELEKLIASIRIERI